MRIGIDIDDTVTNSFEHLQPCIAEYFNVDLEYLIEQNISYCTLPKEWADQELAFSKACYDRVVGQGTVKEGAVQYISRLKEDGHEIYFVTARTNLVYTDAKGLSEEQLRRNGVPFDKVICTEDKAKACVEEKIDLLIDDTIRHCEEATLQGIRAIVFNSKANRNKTTTLERVSTWKEVYDKIKEV